MIYAQDENPNMQLWCSFLEMTGILQRFLCAQREGDWLDFLSEAGNMLPYIISAGHHKYGVFLPLYLKEMKDLEVKAPQVHHRFLHHGDFTVRRSAGNHNGVSPDMLLEQSYNADVKEKGGLSGITLNPAARDKWLYTKPLVAAVCGELKETLHLKQESGKHHDSGKAAAKRDARLVENAVAAVKQHMFNPLQTSSQDLINIATGEKASEEVSAFMINVKELGMKALEKCLAGDGDSSLLRVPRAMTFDSQKNSKEKKINTKTTTGASEVKLLQ